MVDQDELRVLLALRLKGFADTPLVAEAAQVTPTVAAGVLDKMADDDRVRHRDGAMAGWLLTPAGRAHGEELLASDLDAAGKRAMLDSLYQRFLDHNRPFLALCTDWQVRIVDGEQTINDHADVDYDAEVIARLAATNAAIQPICVELAELLPRFGGYGPGLQHAIDRVLDGDTDWFTKPVINSYHTVWFELHEDLLASLGIERAKEAHA